MFGRRIGWQTEDKEEEWYNFVVITCYSLGFIILNSKSLLHIFYPPCDWKCIVLHLSRSSVSNHEISVQDYWESVGNPWPWHCDVMQSLSERVNINTELCVLSDWLQSVGLIITRDAKYHISTYSNYKDDTFLGSNETNFNPNTCMSPIIIRFASEASPWMFGATLMSNLQVKNWFQQESTTYCHKTNPTIKLL